MTIKLNGSTAGSVALDAPASTTGNADINFKLPVADGTAGQVIKTDGSGNLSFGGAGITQADQWRVTSYFNSYDTVITSNWERNDTDFALIGSGMTESSGVFTFPATGVYRIDFVVLAYRQSGQFIRYIANMIEATTDNSNFNLRGLVYGSLSNDAVAHDTTSQNIIFDVTNTSTHKVRFKVQSEDTVSFVGETTRNQTCATFIRLGDT